MAKANGAAIAAWQAERGLTNKELADMAGISGGHVSRLRRGINDASEETLKDVARALGVAVAVISDVRHAEKAP